MIGRKRKAKQTAKNKMLPLTKDGKVDWTKVSRKLVDQMFSPLVPLEDFLNAKSSRWVNMFIGPISQKDSETLRAELINDFLPITNGPPSGSGKLKRAEKLAAVKQMESHLRYLCKKITGMEGLRPVFEVLPGKINLDRRLQSRAQGVFSWSSGDWIIELNFSTDSPHGKTTAAARRDAYAYVGTGLTSGELARLRRCGYCGRFFIAPQPRMTFCPGTDHARLYYDRPSERLR
jgi:hypothetical protein